VASTTPKRLIEVVYEDFAREYLRSLPLEHFMESKSQATQRAITVASLELVKAQRPDFHVFSEMLVQYPRVGERRPGQVVPDNMVVVAKAPPRAELSYSTPVEDKGPFWVMEYVSKGSRRKDYDESFDKYEQALKVPYYLTFYPDTQDLTLYHHEGKKYVTVRPNKHERYAVRELKIEVALLDGWVRFWYRGELLPLPAEMQQGLDKVRRQVEEERQRAEEERQRAEQERQRADELQQRLAQEHEELERLRALLKQRGNGKQA
jgi:Uma2 family endonuclease